MKQTINIEYLSQAAKVSMSDDWFEIANADHFWMQWRFEIFKKYFNRFLSKDENVFEVGCGNGVFRDQLENLGYTVDGCDLNERALKMSNEGNGRLMVYNIFDYDKKLVHNYDSIFLMDVVEHLEDDVQFMQAVNKHLAPEGKVIINVPANMWLFSKYDTEAGHYRRYTKSSMKELLDKVNIEILDMRYWGASLIPIALLRKLVLSMNDQQIIEKGFTPPSKMVHGILKLIKSAEVNLPFSFQSGTSLMVIGKIK